MYVARPQLRRKTVALASEQQQRVIAGRFVVFVVGALFLLAIRRDLCAIHVQHHALLSTGSTMRRIWSSTDSARSTSNRRRVERSGIYFRASWKQIGRATSRAQEDRS